LSVSPRARTAIDLLVNDRSAPAPALASVKRTLPSGSISIVPIVVPWAVPAQSSTITTSSVSCFGASAKLPDTISPRSPCVMSSVPSTWFRLGPPRVNVTVERWPAPVAVPPIDGVPAVSRPAVPAVSSVSCAVPVCPVLAPVVDVSVPCVVPVVPEAVPVVVSVVVSRAGAADVPDGY
jgi:hypothetical protein